MKLSPVSALGCLFRLLDLCGFRLIQDADRPEGGIVHRRVVARDRRGGISVAVCWTERRG